MGTEVIVNKKWSLTTRQWLLGLVQAVFGPVIAKIGEIASGGALSFDWEELVVIAIASAAPYILRKLNESSVVTVQEGDESTPPKFG